MTFLYGYPYNTVHRKQSTHIFNNKILGGDPNCKINVAPAVLRVRLAVCGGCTGWMQWGLIAHVLPYNHR